MNVRFTIAQLLRSTMFFAIGFWMVTWTWREMHAPPPHHHMVGFVAFLIPAAFGGAIGALLGKSPHGVFWAMVWCYGLLLGLVATIFLVDVVRGLPAD